MKHYFFKLSWLIVLFFMHEVCIGADEKSFVFIQQSTNSGELYNAPDNVTASFSTTYSSTSQLTSGNSMTLTIKGLTSAVVITGIQLYIRTNANSGNGTATATMNGNKFATYTYDFVSNNYRDVDMSTTPTVGSGDLVIKISCTKNSVYCSKFTIFYKENVSDSPLSFITLSGDYPTSFSKGSTFNHDGMTVTATYEDLSTRNVTDQALFTGYDMSVIGSQTVTVSYTERETTKTANYNISVNPIPEHRVTWNVDGNTTVVEYEEGETVIFPSAPADINGKTFVGWVDTPIIGVNYDVPNCITEVTMGEEDLTFYAVFATRTEGSVTEITDILTLETTGIGSTTTYSNWSGKKVSSEAVYAGNSSGKNRSIQLRSTENSGLVTTSSGGRVRCISIEWEGSTSNGKSINIYAKNSSYSGPSNLINNDKRGTKIGSLRKGETTLTVDGDYTFIGIRTTDGPVYLTSISITWKNGTANSYSGYCTSVSNNNVGENINNTLSIYNGNQEESTSETTFYGTNINLRAEVATGYDGSITAEISNPDIADVSINDCDIEITPKAVGSTMITFKAPETDHYVGEAKWEFELIVQSVEPKENLENWAGNSETPQVTISDSGYGSFCCEYPLDFSTSNENYDAWYVSEVSGYNVVFKKIKNTIKGGVPFILYGTPGNYNMSLAEESTIVPEGNLLIGTLAPTYVVSDDSYTNYGLSGGKFVCMNDGVVRSNKAYLRIPNSHSFTRMSIVFDEEVTGINDLTKSSCKTMPSSIYYDLFGRRVKNPRKGNIYIRGGKITVR